MAHHSMFPRFPQEIFDLIIDEAAAGYHKDWSIIMPANSPFQLRGDHNKRSRPSPAILQTFALVCWSWYRAAAKHLWRTVSISGSQPHRTEKLLSILNKTPILAEMIRDVELYAFHHPYTPVDELEPDPITAVCRALAPMASVKVVYDNYYDSDDEEGVEMFEEDMWLQTDPVSATAITSLCRPEHLTTFVFQGRVLPTQLLLNLPNLVDLSLQDPGPWNPMHASSPPLGLTSERMPFCLKRASFSISNEVLMPFLSKEPQVFVGLEELELDAASDPHNHETTAALFLWLGGQHLKKIYFKTEDLDSCLKNLFFFSLVNVRVRHDYIVLPELQHLTVRLRAVEYLAHEWTILHDYLASPQFACPKLEYLEIDILHWFDARSAVALSDPAHVAWEVMHACLGPDRFPMLKEFNIRAIWTVGRSSLPDDAEELAKEEKRIQDRCADVKRLITSCFPVWEGDGRGLRLRFSCEPCYFGKSKAEIEANEA